MLFTKGCYESKLPINNQANKALEGKQNTFFLSFFSELMVISRLIIKAVIITGALEVLRVMRNQGVSFNKETFTLAYATCYKLVRSSSTHHSYSHCCFSERVIISNIVLLYARLWVSFEEFCVKRKDIPHLKIATPTLPLPVFSTLLLSSDLLYGQI